MSFTISKTTRVSLPRLDFERMKEDILGKRYDLSLVFVGKTRAQQLNKEYRGKDYYPNVLTFPVDTNVGEIYICPTVVKQQMKKFNMSYKGLIGYMFIHGLYHLKGFDHGDTMDKKETAALMHYNLT